MIAVIFSAAEVQAALAGTLTEIRRTFREASDSVPASYRAAAGGPPDVATAVHPDGSGKGWIAWWGLGPFTAEDTARLYPKGGVPCPLGAPGDLLWIRERCILPVFDDDPDQVVYAADHADPEVARAEIQEGADGDVRWRPAICMPRWASRLAFRSRGVRVESVGDIWTWIAAVERVNRPDGSPMPPREIGGTS